jgi:hypothetical protein
MPTLLLPRSPLCCSNDRPYFSYSLCKRNKYRYFITQNWFHNFCGGGEAIRLHALHVAVKKESYLRPTDLARVTKVLFIFISSNGPSILELFPNYVPLMP